MNTSQKNGGDQLGDTFDVTNPNHSKGPVDWHTVC